MKVKLTNKINGVTLKHTFYVKENQNYMAQDVSSDFRRSFYENREINNNNDISPSRSLLIKNT